MMEAWGEKTGVIPYSNTASEFPAKAAFIGMDHCKVTPENIKSFKGKELSADCKQSNMKSFAKRFKEFGDDTTFHGVRYVTNNNHHPFRRFIWLLVVLGMSTWLSLIIACAIQDYFRYPVTSTVSINYVENITFPAVTLCNFNQFKKSMYHPEDLEILREIFGPFPSESINFNSSSYTNTTGISDDIFWYGTHSLERMLVDCSWKRTNKCTAANFTRRFTDHGMCYSFNDFRNEKDRLTVRSAGRKDGLYMRLYAEHDEYTFWESEAAGFRVLLHPQGVTPLVRELGFSVSPGFETSVTTRLNVIKSLPHPFESNCTDHKLSFSPTYTVPSCRFECKVKYVTAKCGCRDFRWPIGEFQNLDDIGCSCPISCTTKAYESRLSLAYWPANHVAESYIDSYPNVTETYIRKNFLDVYIFFEELSYLKIEQKAAYSMSSLQSDVGGYMGLLCGMSMMTLIEWGDFIFNTILRNVFTKH